MEMIVLAQVLPPRVQHGGDPNLPAEAPAAELQQRGARAGKKQPVKRRAILADQRVERMRQREDHMKIRHRQQVLLLAREPRLREVALAARAMPVAATV